MGISFNVIEKKDYTVIEFKLEEAIIEPNLLKIIEPPKVDASKGVVLSGRGPIWIYCFLVHYYHPTAFVATFDPRLGGAVVVESHKKGFNVGEVIKLGGD